MITVVVVAVAAAVVTIKTIMTIMTTAYTTTMTMTCALKAFPEFQTRKLPDQTNMLTKALLSTP